MPQKKTDTKMHVKLFHFYKVQNRTKRIYIQSQDSGYLWRGKRSQSLEKYTRGLSGPMLWLSRCICIVIAHQSFQL